jgi:hypothetical protein
MASSLKKPVTEKYAPEIISKEIIAEAPIINERLWRFPNEPQKRKSLLPRKLTVLFPNPLASWHAFPFIED